jgi:hypothetical protein
MSQTIDFVPSSQLVIRDPDACRLAEELVRLTGEGLETVLVTALHQAIEREQKRVQFHERIMAITRDIAGASRASVGGAGSAARD